LSNNELGRFTHSFTFKEEAGYTEYMQLFSLDGQVAFVTGAGSGIGQRLAIGLAEAGADVACFDLPTSRELDLTVEKIQALGKLAVKYEGDVTRAEDLQKTVEGLEQHLGPLSIALNCAGIANAAPAEEMSLEQWQRTIDVNLTGASRGIGAGIAERFANEGARLVLSANEERVHQVVEELNGKGVKAISVLADVTSKADVEALFAKAEQEFGQIDISIHNAGFITIAKLENLTEEEWDKVLDINTKGVSSVVRQQHTI
jgi:NAD(P)-dependent dehydrogenase (short-subunit alcohol dehydrogenase family)